MEIQYSERKIFLNYLSEGKYESALFSLKLNTNFNELNAMLFILYIEIKSALFIVCCFNECIIYQMIKLKIKAIDDIMINEFIAVLLLVVPLVVALELESVTTVNYVRWGVVQVITPLTLVVINPA